MEHASPFPAAQVRGSAIAEELAQTVWEPPPEPSRWQRLRAIVSRSPLQSIEALVAVSMLASTAVNSYVVYRFQVIAIEQQTSLATAALTTDEVGNWRNLFSTNSPQINLRTTEGRAAYAICL